MHDQTHFTGALHRVEQMGDARQGNRQRHAGAEHARENQNIAHVLREAGAGALVRHESRGERALVDAGVALAHRHDHAVAMDDQTSRTDPLERVLVAGKRADEFRGRRLLAHVAQQGGDHFNHPQGEQGQYPAVGYQARGGQLVTEIEVFEEIDIGQNSGHDNQSEDNQP